MYSMWMKGCRNGSLTQMSWMFADTGYGRVVEATWGAEFILNSVQDLILLQSESITIFFYVLV